MCDCFLCKEETQLSLVVKVWGVIEPWTVLRAARELSTSCREKTGAACKVSSGKGGIVRREKSTVTRFFLADWQLSSSPALGTTQAECLRSSLSLYTRRHVGVKGKVQHIMTSPDWDGHVSTHVCLKITVAMPVTESVTRSQTWCWGWGRMSWEWGTHPQMPVYWQKLSYNLK